MIIQSRLTFIKIRLLMTISSNFCVLIVYLNRPKGDTKNFTAITQKLNLIFSLLLI
jgi:hypothetical protein